MADESTTKLRMDISELKKSMVEARRQIRLANAEFKASTSGMDKWSDSADGLTAKMEQLETTLKSEKSILSDLKKQHELVVQAEGANSRGAEELLIKIKNQEAAIGKTEASLKRYKQQLQVLSDINGVNKQVSAFDELGNSISKQENALNDLKSKYSSVILEQGETSNEARKLASEIEQLSNSLKENKTKFEQVENSANALDHSLEEAGTSAEEAGDGFTILKGTLSGLLADGIKSVVSGLKEITTESSRAFNNFQAQTGASTEEMQAFRKEIEELYKNAYGESLNDIGDKMAYVKQVTGEVDASKIKELTENAIALEDTFGSDFSETVRGVKNLMEHFGISATEAFDLFAKGSQLGLDYTDELGDNIAEYGGNFQQAGYSASEYFQLLANGTKNGAYNLDKVNDSINEVKNRLGDGTIGDNIKLFSKDTKQMFENWSNGKGAMKNVIDSIVNDISNCTNEQEALTMAQTAFGTMGEDANLKVVKALKSTGNEFQNVQSSMESIKNIRYDDVGTQFTELGRTFQTDFLIPVAEEALPTLKDFVGFAVTNLNTIIPVATTAGAAIGGMFVVNKAAEFINSTKTIITTLGALTVATSTAEASTLALNAAWLTSPVGIATVAVGALAGAIALYVSQSSKSKKKTDENITATNELAAKQKELNSAIKDGTNTRKESIATATSEANQADFYFEKLQNLLDAEKKSASQKALIAQYVEKLNSIMPELNLQYDEEKDKLNQSTDSIKNNIAAQKELILAKAAQGNLESIASQIVDIESQQATLTKQNTQNEKDYYAIKKKNAEWLKSIEERNYNVGNEEYQRYMSSIELEAQKKEAYDKTSGAIEKNKKSLEKLNSEYDKTANYAQEKMDSAELTKSISAITEKMKAEGKKIPQAVSEGMKNGQYVVPTTVAAMLNLITFNDLIAKAGIDGKKIPKKLAEGISSGKISAEKAAKQLADSVSKGEKTAVNKSKKNGKTTGTAHANAVSSTKKQNQKAGSNIGNSAVNGTKNGSKSMSKTGTNAGKQYSSGVSSQNSNANAKGKNLANSAKSGASSVDATQSGRYFSQGFINGIGSLISSAYQKAKELAQRAWAGLKKGQQEGSPSKLTYQSGKYFTQGFINGIVSQEGKLVKVIQNLAKNAVNELKNIDNFNFSEVGNNVISAFSDTFAKKVNYMSARMEYENQQKIKDFESTISKYETQEKKWENKYDTSKKAYDKAKTNYDKAKKNYKNAKSSESKTKYKKQMQQYQKEMAKDKKQMQQYKKNADKYKDLVKSTTKYKETYEEASSQMISQYNNALNEYQTKAQELIENTINGITELYTQKYDDLISKQDTLIDKLKNAGELFEISNAGVITINDIKSQTEQIKEYSSKLQEIKKKVSSDLFDEIADFDMDQGGAFIDQLLNMSEEELKAYNDAYEERNRLAEELGKETYAQDFKNLKKDWENAVDEATKDLPKQLEELGKECMQGFVDGLKENTDYMSKSVRTIISAMIDNFKKDLKIHSPSKVMYEIGDFSMDGFVNPIKDRVQEVKKLAHNVSSSFVDGFNGISIDDIDATKGTIMSNGRSVRNVSHNVTNNYNLVQNNTSPKSLSALDTYRARRKQLAMVKALTT